MQTICRRAIEKEIKKEYAEARHFCSKDFGRYYKMMLDFSDGQIWADVFIDVNTWKSYQSDTIVQLKYVPGYVSETTQAYIDNAVEYLQAAGWIIMDCPPRPSPGEGRRMKKSEECVEQFNEPCPKRPNEEPNYFIDDTEDECHDYGPSNPWDAPGMSIRDFI